MFDITTKAHDLAIRAHAPQTRWDGSPYIEHPERVAEKFSDKTYKAVALLHDVVEDTDYTFDDLYKSFPDFVVEPIKELTKPYTLDYFDYIDQLKNPIAIAIKIEDLKDNLSDLDQYEKTDKLKEKYKFALKLLQLKQKVSQFTKLI